MAQDAEYLSERGRTERRAMRPLTALAAVLALGLAADEVRSTGASGSVSLLVGHPGHLEEAHPLGVGQ